LGSNAGLRRYLLYTLYALLPVGAVVALGLNTMAGTVVIVAAVIGLVAVSVTS
jgi:hypothetical protein